MATRELVYRVSLLVMMLERKTCRPGDVWLPELETFPHRLLADGLLACRSASFLDSLPSSLGQLEMALQSFGLLKESICGLSIRALAGRHTHWRPAPMRPVMVESISFRLLADCGVALPVRERSGPVGLLQLGSIAFRQLAAACALVSVARSESRRLASCDRLYHISLLLLLAWQRT